MSREYFGGITVVETIMSRRNNQNLGLIYLRGRKKLSIREALKSARPLLKMCLSSVDKPGISSRCEHVWPISSQSSSTFNIMRWRKLKKSLRNSSVSETSSFVTRIRVMALYLLSRFSCMGSYSRMMSSNIR